MGRVRRSNGGTGGITLITNNTERIRITNSGGVGIGTTDPGAILEVTGDYNTGKYLLIKNKDSANSWGSTEIFNGTRYISVSGRSENTNRFQVGPGGVSIGDSYNPPTYQQGGTCGLVVQSNVGIGITDSTHKLAINQQDSSKAMIHTLGKYTATGSTYGYQPILYHQSLGPTSYNNISAEIGITPIYNGSWAEGPASRMSFKLNSTANANNGWGPIPDVEVMTLNGWGNVGIGTTNPGATLHVGGNGAKFIGYKGEMYSTDAFTGQTLPNWLFEISPLGNSWNGDGNKICQASSILLKAEPLKWAGGSVNIPGAELIIEGGKSNRGANTGASIIFKTYDAERMRITPWGNVGIGTTNARCKFDVMGFGNGNTTDYWIAGAFGAASTSTAPRVVMGAYYNVAVVGAHTSDLSQWANLSINPGGNVGIGITDPNDIYRPLCVKHGGQPWQVAGTYFESGGPGPDSLKWTWAGKSDVAIVAVGGIISTTYIGVFSDQRIKKDIKQLSYSLEDLMKIQPVEYFFKDTIKNNGQKQVGFIAQQVKEVIPEVVSIDEGTIPDAFQVTPILDRNSDKILVRLPEGLDWKDGETIKLISEKDGDIEGCKVVEIIGDLCWIHVKEKWEGLGERVFLYGKRTKDLHNIDYGKLTPLLVKGMQEQQLVISEQSRTISEQQQTIQDLNSRLSRVESLLSQLVR